MLAQSNGMIDYEGSTLQETDREKFVRLGNARLAAAVDKIELLENLLQNPYRYNFDNNDISIFINTLLSSINRLSRYKKILQNISP